MTTPIAATGTLRSPSSSPTTDPVVDFAPQVGLAVKPDLHLRIARPTDNLAALAAMYAEGLGLTRLGSFSDHDGFDGVMLGHPDQPWHLEFTASAGIRLVERPPRTTCWSSTCPTVLTGSRVAQICWLPDFAPFRRSTPTGISAARPSRTRMATASCSRTPRGRRLLAENVNKSTATERMQTHEHKTIDLSRGPTSPKAAWAAGNWAAAGATRGTTTLPRKS